MVSDKQQLPTDWSMITLSDLATVSGGKRLPKGEKLIDIYTGHPYIRVANMKEKGIDSENILYVPSEVADSIKRYKIYSGELYISVAGTLGLVGTVPEELDGANLTENANRISDIKCNPEYLLYVLKSRLIQKYIEREKTISAQPKLALTRIKNFQIPIPNNNIEQQKIASILSSVDEAIEKTEQIIEQTETVKKGVMQQLLTKGIGHTEFQKTIIGEVPKEWKIKKLGEYAYIKARIGWRGLSSKEYIEKGPYLIAGKHIERVNILWSECDHISNERYEESPEIMLNENDIILTKDGTIGRAAIIEKLPGKATINGTMMLVRPNEKFVPKFLYYYFQGAHFKTLIKEKVSGSSVPHLFQRDIVTLTVPIPKKEEQNKIVNILEAYDIKIESEYKKSNSLKRIKYGLMQQLLTGKVRVPIDENEEVPS